MFKIPSVSGAALALLGVLLAFPAPSQGSQLTLIDATGVLFQEIELRPGVTADIHVTVMGEVDDRDCLLILHGGPFTAEGWRPFAEALGSDACVFGLDMPARGLSTPPVGIVFGELLLDDYVSIVLGVLDRLDSDLDLEPRSIAGHSLGGVVLQMTQQRLIDEGSSLKKRFRIRDAILIASDFPQEVPWTFGDNDGAAAIAPFIVSDPVLGSIMRIEAEVWPAFFFTNIQGAVVPGAPTPTELVANGWVAPGEPAQALNQLLGAPPFTGRPNIAPKIFSKKEGTKLRVMAFEGDGFILPSDSQGLYSYLTGDEAEGCFVGVLGADTVHALHMSDPATLVAAFEGSDDCRYRKKR